MIDQTMSLYIPRVWGGSNDEIKARISEQMAAQGLGNTSRVDVDRRPEGNRQAFVHFSEWLDTEGNAELQAQIRDRAASREGPRMSCGGVGYWILKENTSPEREAPRPRAGTPEHEDAAWAGARETILLQSKTIRDLKAQLAEKDEALRQRARKAAAAMESHERMSKRMDSLVTTHRQVLAKYAELEKEAGALERSLREKEKTASQEAAAWAKARAEAGSDAKDLAALDETIERMWQLESRSSPGTMRTVILGRDGTWNCDCPARGSCWHIQKCKDQLAAEAAAGKEAQGGRDKKFTMAWSRVASLERERDFCAKARDEAQKEVAEREEELEVLRGMVNEREAQVQGGEDLLEATRIELEETQDEVARLKALVALPPPGPLKRSSNNPIVSSPEDYEDLRKIWERQGIEGETESAPAAAAFQSALFVGDALERGPEAAPPSRTDVTYDRMVAQTRAFANVQLSEGLAPMADWAPCGPPAKMLVDPRGSEISTLSALDEMDSAAEMAAWKRSKSCNGGLGDGTQAVAVDA